MNLMYTVNVMYSERNNTNIFHRPKYPSMYINWYTNVLHKFNKPLVTAITSSREIVLNKFNLTKQTKKPKRKKPWQHQQIINNSIQIVSE